MSKQVNCETCEHHKYSSKGEHCYMFKDAPEAGERCLQHSLLSSRQSIPLSLKGVKKTLDTFLKEGI